MLVDRRTFAAGSAALLSGCATVGTRRIAGCTPLPPVLVDQSRVIRTMAGLRPYRRSGFVVRVEALGDKRLVHNYGHGGGGITLSWGSSKLATELGLQGLAVPEQYGGAGFSFLELGIVLQEMGRALVCAPFFSAVVSHVKLNGAPPSLLRSAPST